MATPARFGPFEFDQSTGELTRDGQTVRLEPQPARLLALLVARPGGLVTRDEARQAIWGDDVHVDADRGLAYAVSQVRAALGDSADAPLFVETLPRRGFRFVAPVDSATAEASPSSTPALAARRMRARTLAITGIVVVALGVWGAFFRQPAEGPRLVLAVAMFDNETGDPAFDGLSGRMADAVVTSLMSQPDARLGVIGNEAVLRLPRDERDLDAIGAATRADLVVLGQVQPDPAGLRVVAHLIRLRDGTHLWAKRLVRPVDRLAGLELDVAEEVALAVRERIADLLGDS